MTSYDTIPAPSGSYVKWEHKGDVVEGRIGSFTVDGGRDFDGNACPELTVETTEGTVTVTCSPANLRRQIEANAVRFRVGHGVRVEFTDTYESKQGTPGKTFTVGVTAEPIAPIVATIADDEAPF